MKEILEKLTLLQKVDKELFKLESVKGDLPQRVTQLNNDVERAKVVLSKVTEKKESALKERGLVELEIKELESSKKRYQDQLYEVKNNREYDAVTQEIENVTKKISGDESRVLELMGIEEETQIELKNAEEALAAVEAKLKEQSAALEETLAKTVKDEEALKKEKAEIASQINNKILATYERILRAKNGLAVVPILTNGVCGGCYKTLPPQRVLEIREGERLFLCEVCGRMLVWNQEKYEAGG